MTDAVNGFCIRHEVARSPGKGLGVFAREPIAEGAIVWRFVPGAFAVYDEVSFAGVLAGLPDAEIEYELTHVFGLADFPDVLIRIFDSGALINHADDANVATNFGRPLEARYRTEEFQVDDVKDALLGDRYALVATKLIAEGEELTNNYAGDVVDPPFYDRLCKRYGISDAFLDGA